MKLEMDDISLEYRSESKTIQAISHLNLSVCDGQAISVIGPSGCGKSSMLSLAAGLISPTVGKTLVDGENLDKPRKTTAYIQQDLGILPWKTVLQNVELPLKLRNVPGAESRSKSLSAVERVGLGGFENSYPKELSGGMRQRVALARALVVDADLVLLDEPLSALDALNRERMQETLLELFVSRRHSQILVTHSIEEAVYLGQSIVVLSPRPARVVEVVSNPDMGEAGYRVSDSFSRLCKEIRAILAPDEGEAA